MEQERSLITCWGCDVPLLHHLDAVRPFIGKGFAAARMRHARMKGTRCIGFWPTRLRMSPYPCARACTVSLSLSLCPCLCACPSSLCFLSLSLSLSLSRSLSSCVHVYKCMCLILTLIRAYVHLHLHACKHWIHDAQNRSLGC